MDEADSQLLAKLLLGSGNVNQLNPALMVQALAEGERSASDRMKGPVQQGSTLGEIPIPQMHQGKLFNLGGRQWDDGRAQSLDFYLQPKMSPQGLPSGINSAGLLFRKTW